MAPVLSFHVQVSTIVGALTPADAANTFKEWVSDLKSWPIEVEASNGDRWDVDSTTGEVTPRTGLRKAAIEAWDWDEMIGTSFPEWFHEFADEALQNSDVSYGDNSATIFSGPVAVTILDSAYYSLMLASVPGIGSEQYAEAKKAIELAVAAYDLNNRSTRVVVWS